MAGKRDGTSRPELKLERVPTIPPLVKALVRANPCWALLLLCALFSTLTLLILGAVSPPGPFSQIPYGPISLSLLFPSHNLAGREPILAGGVKGNAYTVSAENVGTTGQVRFVYETWGAPEQLSPPIAVAPGVRYPVVIDLPQLRAPTQEAGVPFSIVFNGNLLMQQQVPYAHLAVKSLWIGTNPLNGPYLGRDIFPGPPKPYAFSGQILDVQRVETGQAAPSGVASFLANRLLPNLRYQIEIAPHIFYWSVLAGVLTALASVLLLLPSGARSTFVSRLRFLLTPVFITAFPILPLLQISRTYRADWLNHGWIMEYYGQFLKAHHWLPHMVNSHQAVGMVSPLFYGHFLYSIGGFFSAVAGADIGLRLALFTALFCQTLCVRRTVWRLTGSLAIADTVSALVCWSIYPITNLYGGSVMEFMAVCYLTCCICLFVDFCRQPTNPIQWLAVAEFALFFVLAANHPITGLLGGLMLGAMTVIILALSPSGMRIGRSLLAAALLTLFLLSPWIYMYARYGKQIFIGRETVGTKLEYFEFDTLLARFMPFPYDAKSISIGALSETSYADMQLNLPLLLAGLSGIVFARKSLRRAKPSSTDELPAKGLLWLGWCILAWALAASVYPGVAQLTAVISNRLRYAFRLINVQNWGLLLVTLAWCWLYALRGSMRRGVRNRVWLPALCTALLAVSSISMLQKWAHGSAATEQSAIGHSSEQALIMPYTFYWLMDYVGLAPEVPAATPKQPAEFPLADGAQFGEVQPIDIDLPEKKWLLFNAVASPTNQIYVDGTVIPETNIYREWAKIAIQLNPGKHHIEYRFQPGTPWSILRTITESLFFAIALACIGFETHKLRITRPTSVSLA